MVNSPVTESPTVARSLSAAKAKLIKAAALAAVLVPLGSVPSEGATITCTITPSGTGACGSADGFAVFQGAFTRFDSDGDSVHDYFLNIVFETVLEPFVLTISDFPDDPDVVNDPSKYAAEFQAGSCVPFAPQEGGGDPQCVEFELTATPSDPSPFEDFEVDFAWLLPTDEGYPDPIVLHDKGEPDIYDTDITIPGSYYAGPPDISCGPDGGFYCGGPLIIIIDGPGCELCFKIGDPGISAEDNSFSFMVIKSLGATVPEPATMLLVTLGLGGVCYRRRRQRTH